MEAVKGLSEAQWRFKPAPDRWSVLENVEHLALVGTRVRWVLERMEQAEVAPPDRDPKPMDAFILTDALDRSKKIQGPPSISPGGEWTPAQALERFLSGAASVTEGLAKGPRCGI